MSGAITVNNVATCRGWARIKEDGHYPVTVHLICDDVIVSSTIASDVCKGDEDEHDNCWFEFPLSDIPTRDRANSFVVVGESGEMLGKGQEAGAVKAHQLKLGDQEVTTYRDALAAGLTPEDVIGAFYLDVLKRPVDGAGLNHLLSEIQTGAINYDQVRQNLFLSEEYGRHRRRLTDAPGRLFARKIIYHTAARTLAFELLLGSFLRKDCPLDTKLLRFFPALAILPNAAADLARDVANGLSQREIFFRALSQLSGRPSLLLDPAVLSGQDMRIAREDFTQVDERTCLVPCRSRLFASGWQEIEFGASGEFRWMMQIGVLYNPKPDASVERVEIAVDACFADPAGVLAFSEGQALRCRLQEKAGGELTLAVTADGGSFRASYLVLVARDASCPLRFNGTPDPRLISISLREARFVTLETAA